MTSIRRFRVIFLRHGQTDHNERKILQGHHNAPLNDRGRSQASRAGKALSQRTIHRIVSSDLRRAYETAEIVKKAGPSSWPSIESIEECRERMFGEAEDKPLADFINAAAKSGTKPEQYTPEGAESLDIFFERVKKCVHDVLISKHGNDDCILFVSHGGVIREIIKYLMNLDIDKSGLNLRVGTSPNTGITEIVFEVENDTIKSIDTVLLYNKSHLESEDGTQEDYFKDER